MVFMKKYIVGVICAYLSSCSIQNNGLSGLYDQLKSEAEDSRHTDIQDSLLAMGPEAVRFLVKKYPAEADYQVRFKIMDILGRSKDSAAVPLIKKTAVAGQWDERVCAIDALSEYARPDFLDIYKTCAQDSNEYVAAAGVVASNALKTAEGARFALGYINDRRAWVRLSLASDLYINFAPAAAADYFDAYQSARDGYVQCFLLEALHKNQYPLGTDILVQALGHPNQHLADAAAIILKERKNPGTAAIFKERLLNKNVHGWVKGHACEYFEKTKNSGFIPKDTLGLPADYAFQLYRFLAKQGYPEAIRRVIQIVRNEKGLSIHYRMACMNTVQELGEKSAIPALQSAARNAKSIRVKKKVWEALASLGDTSGVYRYQGNVSFEEQPGNRVRISWTAHPKAVSYNIYKSSFDDYRLGLYRRGVASSEFIDTLYGEKVQYGVSFNLEDGTESVISEPVKVECKNISHQEPDKNPAAKPLKSIGTKEHPALLRMVSPQRRAEIIGSDWSFTTNQTDVVIGDLDNDGIIDFIVTQRGASRAAAYTGTGKYLWERRFNMTTTPIHDYRYAVGDFDEDGKSDVAVLDRAADSMYLRILDAVSGAVKKSRELNGLVNDQWELRDDVHVADLKGTGKNQTIIYHHNCYSRVDVTAFDSDLNILWQYKTGNATGHRALIEDLDGDGRDDIVVGAKDIINHKGQKLFSVPDYVGDGHYDMAGTGDIDPQNPGLEIVFATCHNECVFMTDLNGRILWHDFPGHQQWLVLGDFYPKTAGLEALVTFRSLASVVWNYDSRGVYASQKANGAVARIDWDGDLENGDELVTREGTIIRPATGEILGRFNNMFLRVCDVAGDYREEVVTANFKDGTLDIYGAPGQVPEKHPSRWDQKYWRFESKYKRSYAKEYVNRLK
ncbi:MAG: hypothetical protein A2487_09215 [Candidatus Raymondbacteria bacterium RifOxyC12_full_50_8]|uniref:Rhamnogalacturonan lyase family 11 C-terminal domain-containing protein n=1 Tax=Candidatus Raymondbacteria bacterium RIFOXYD12_FULL_49_13 TaxID=1817890 RepID=A0A1F7FF99_UNCRA|nr:MAG: hypothetical protein A2248_22725 [Candidatus Raymondbacteria bacterium RIFOXYA2_FULL_49_16]OGJ94599.1 MAG: hypothetical protein A2350_05945 [Candidatus Raymondbacteria bacterium RifOxyB12_full_50_8]OGJ98869.1 MAG: hypothetical protein A2487_09215 [Candidatus Raymondbacteria bacterium RifOxyC12_full_50_8]OGK05380.1 MAG: hypothetical protein A2519_03675 [Candidatus Raymondbacteria bacterium RIFOXYD12_FULL_49_13]OGP42993.1 MAG: hypothetical protein A2324_16380 [Candidatus Raymondbacteria b